VFGSVATTAPESAFAPVQTAPKKSRAQKKNYGAVCVASGDGFEAIFRELGADEIIRGGQTNNPSAKDFLDAFEKINAEHIFVFPNNSNILLAATQAAGIYEESKIHVIESKSMGTGYAALASLDFGNESAQSIEAMAEEAMSKVLCGYVSPAIRDAEMNGIQIKNGDTIGIVAPSGPFKATTLDEIENALNR
jgi:dihydroxyacetone kinase-like predicted kinase